MGLRGVVSAVVLGAAMSASASAGSVDWSKAKRIPDEGLQWGVIPLDGGEVDAFFGRPESDYVVVRVGCPAPRTLAFSYIDSTMKPQAKYRVHARTGQHEFLIAGATGERWELDDLVELKFGPTATRQLYDDLKGGAELALVIEEVSGPWSTGVAMPGDAKALAPFFAACEK
jgi:hypothetical protein